MSLHKRTKLLLSAALVSAGVSAYGWLSGSSKQENLIATAKHPTVYGAKLFREVGSSPLNGDEQLNRLPQGAQNSAPNSPPNALSGNDAPPLIPPELQPPTVALDDGTTPYSSAPPPNQVIDRSEPNSREQRRNSLAKYQAQFSRQAVSTTGQAPPSLQATSPNSRTAVVFKLAGQNGQPSAPAAFTNELNLQYRNFMFQFTLDRGIPVESPMLKPFKGANKETRVATGKPIQCRNCYIIPKNFFASININRKGKHSVAGSGWYLRGIGARGCNATSKFKKLIVTRDTKNGCAIGSLQTVSVFESKAAKNSPVQLSGKSSISIVQRGIASSTERAR